MPDALRPYVSRVAAAVVALLVTWLTAKGTSLDTIAQSSIQQLIEITIYVASYAISHRAIDIRVNPDDAASPHAAAIGKRKQKQRKSEREIEERIKQEGARAPYFRDPDYPDVRPRGAEPPDRGE